jgi:hypothetical protein
VEAKNLRMTKKISENIMAYGRFPLTRPAGQMGQIVELNTKHLGFGPIWPENLDNIRTRSIFARYLRNVDQIDLSIDTEKRIRVWPVRPLNGKRPMPRRCLLFGKWRHNLQTKIHIFYAQTYYRSSAVGNGRELLFIGGRKRGPEAGGNF